MFGFQCEHKIQSNDGPPIIALRLVPKVLKAVTHIWAPNAYIISFKLETDNTMLEQKSKGALTKYKHQVCHNISIFNILLGGYMYYVYFNTFSMFNN